MIVFSHEKWSELGEFDPESGQLAIFDREESNFREKVPAGHFSRVAGEYCVFYRYCGNLYLQIGSANFALDDGISVFWKNTDGASVFKVFSGRCLVKTLKYIPRQTEKIAGDFTAWEPEHSDFGLFVKNVLDDQERSHIIYRP